MLSQSGASIPMVPAAFKCVLSLDTSVGCGSRKGCEYQLQTYLPSQQLHPWELPCLWSHQGVCGLLETGVAAENITPSKQKLQKTSKYTGILLLSAEEQGGKYETVTYRQDGQPVKKLGFRSCKTSSHLPFNGIIVLQSSSPALT